MRGDRDLGAAMLAAGMATLLLPGAARADAADLAAARADLAALHLPSGQTVTLNEVVWPAAGASGKTVARFRFLAPKIAHDGAGGAGRVGPDAAEDDMQALCDRVALPEVKRSGRSVDQVVVSLSQKALPLGERRPDVVQFFDAYDIGNGTCEWQGL